MDLGEVLSKAWKIIWKNKILWIFGILASCSQSSGGSGGGGSNTRMGQFGNNGNLNNGNDLFSKGQYPALEEFFKNLDKVFTSGTGDSSMTGIILGLLCLFLFIFLICLMLGAIGRIGLIRGTVLAEEGQEPLHFGQVWAASTPYFWKVFFLNLLVSFVVLLVVAILVVPMLFLTFGTFGIGLICLIPALCLLIPVSLVLNVIVEQANVALVVENLGIWDAVKRGWSVCRENLGPMAVVALVVILGGGIVGIIISLPLIFMIFPVAMMGISKDQATVTSMVTLIGVMFCCLTPLIVFLQGVLTSYIGSIWTLTFLRLTGKQPEQPGFQVTTMSE